MMNNYDLIIIQGFIWDLTRYSDNEGKNYLKDVDLFLSNVQNFRHKLLWLILPPSGSDKSAFINNLLTKLKQMIIEKLETNHVNYVNLKKYFQTDAKIRHRDGIHFTPIGYRMITEKIFEHTKKLGSESTSETINSATVSSSSSLLLNIYPSGIRQQKIKESIRFILARIPLTNINKIISRIEMNR